MPRLIILAAGQGTRLRPLTDDRPKCLVEVGNRPLLDWQLDVARRAGIEDVTVVGGYRADRLAGRPVRLIVNTRFATTNMVESLWCAETLLQDDVIVAYGDILAQDDVLRQVLDSHAEIAVAVDRAWRPYWEARFDDVLSDAESLRIEGGQITSIGQRAHTVEEIDGQYVGLMRFRGCGLAHLRTAYARAHADQAQGRHPFGGPRPMERLFMTDLLFGMIGLGCRIEPVEIHGGWVEVDSPDDRAIAERAVRVVGGVVTIDAEARARRA